MKLKRPAQTCDTPRKTKRIATELDIRDRLAGLFLETHSNKENSKTENQKSFIIELKPGMEKEFLSNGCISLESEDESMDVDSDTADSEDEKPVFKIPDMFIRK